MKGGPWGEMPDLWRCRKKTGHNMHKEVKKEKMITRSSRKKRGKCKKERKRNHYFLMFKFQSQPLEKTPQKRLAMLTNRM